MGDPALKRNATPRKMLNVANVTMNEGIRPYDERNPLIAPMTTLMIRTMTMAEGTDLPSNLIRDPMIMVSSARAEPGDRSMPPVRITNVEPTATIATMLACRATLLRLSSRRKRSVDMVTATETTNSEMMGPITGIRDNGERLGVMRSSLSRMVSA